MELIELLLASKRPSRGPYAPALTKRGSIKLDGALKVLERSHFLQDVSTAWSQLPVAEYPFAKSLAKRLQSHDDREDFLSGVDIILRGAKSA